MNSFLASTREQPTGTWMVLLHEVIKSQNVRMSQDFIQNWGHFPEIEVIQEPFSKVNLVLSAQDHWFCTLAKLGSVFSNWISARPRQGGDQVDHARDVHSPQNPWLSLNRAPQITIFSILSRITSRLMDPSNLNSEFCDIKRETTVTTQLKQMPIRSKCPHVMFPRVGPNFPRFPAFHSKYPD